MGYNMFSFLLGSENFLPCTLHKDCKTKTKKSISMYDCIVFVSQFDFCNICVCLQYLLPMLSVYFCNYHLYLFCMYLFYSWCLGRANELLNYLLTYFTIKFVEVWVCGFEFYWCFIHPNKKRVCVNYNTSYHTSF